MSESITERRKRVNRQSDKARTSDKLYPLEIQQAPYGDELAAFYGHSQNIYHSPKGTRQGRQYWMQHDLDVREEQAKLKRKKQKEQAEKLLRKGR